MNRIDEAIFSLADAVHSLCGAMFATGLAIMAGLIVAALIREWLK